MTASLRPTDLGAEAAVAVGDIARRIAGTRTLPQVIEDDLSAQWSALVTGGWDAVGIRDGEDGATLTDLVAIALAWGRQVLPLPFLSTVMTKRWSPPAAEYDGPTTLGVPHPSGQGALVLFADVPGVQLAPELGQSCALPLVAVSAEPDELAPTLRLGRSEAISRISAEAGHELCVVWAAEAVGAARRLHEEAVAYAKIREQFGKPIGTNQAVKHQLADSHILLEQAETAVLWACCEVAQAPRALEFAFRACRDIGGISVQVHGGVGFTWELGLHFPLRHVLALSELARSLRP